MKRYKAWGLILSGVLTMLAVTTLNAREVVIDLAGEGWTLAVDPTDAGESKQWHEPVAGWDGKKPQTAQGWDVVSVPHDFLSDPRYGYVGTAWYRRSVAVPADAQDGRSWRLEFDAVFQRCRVWLNGMEIGAHEGGYTPFSFEVTKHLLPGRQNFLVVAVDNRVKFRALPGARSGTTANSGQYPWMNYGGIHGGVRLLATPPVWVYGQRIETDLQPDGSAKLTVRALVRNDREEAVPVALSAKVRNGQGSELPVSLRATAQADARAVQEVRMQVDLPAGSYERWELANLQTYQSEVTVVAGDVAHRHATQFGFREIEVRGGQFLLNGDGVRIAGANRARGHPVFGGLDPDEAVEQDLRLMKDAGLRFARLQHTAPRKNLLEWADREGMLLILEVGMWGYLAEDVASTELRERFKHEMIELVQLAANHPSVVGWSLGNEYESWTPEGIAWTRDMARFMKEIDPTRPVTFAALGRELRELKTAPAGVERAFDYVDFISTNVYFNLNDLPDFLDRVNARWPDKPVFISEYGLRADRVKAEAERLAHFDQMLAFVRARPWVCGFAYWSFNDYQSRYPGTGSDGFRRWGLVDEHRQPRMLYQHIRERIKDGFETR
jgi:beta-glucuronidase